MGLIVVPTVHPKVWNRRPFSITTSQLPVELHGRNLKTKRGTPEDSVLNSVPPSSGENENRFPRKGRIAPGLSFPIQRGLRFT